MATSRFRIDIVFAFALLALSFLPAVGTEEGHFAVAAATFRVLAISIAGVGLLFVSKRLPSQARPALDFAFAALFALLALSERFPAGNHLRETAIYSAYAVFLGLFAVTGIRRRRSVASQPA